MTSTLTDPDLQAVPTPQVPDEKKRRSRQRKPQMDGVPKDTAAAAASPGALTSSCSSTATEWSPEAHSWILVPEALSSDHTASTAQPHSLVGITTALPLTGLAPDESSTPGMDELRASESSGSTAGVAPPVAITSPAPSPPLASPTMSPKSLSTSFLHDGETVADLTVSELLSPEFQFFPPRPATEPLASSDAAHDHPEQPASAPRKLGALAFPPVECALCGGKATPQARSTGKGVYQGPG